MHTVVTHDAWYVISRCVRHYTGITQRLEGKTAGGCLRKSPNGEIVVPQGMAIVALSDWHRSPVKSTMAACTRHLACVDSCRELGRCLNSAAVVAIDAVKTPVTGEAFSISYKTSSKTMACDVMEVVPCMQVWGTLDASCRKRACNLGIYRASCPVLGFMAAGSA